MAVERMCQECGKVILGTGKKFCSLECSYAGRTQRTLSARQCLNPECGKTFKPNNHKHSFCTQKCYWEAPASVKTKGESPPRKCRNCGDSFVPARKTQAFCVHSCSVEWHTTNSMVPFDCPHCGETKLVHPDKNRKFCSVECRTGSL